MSDSSSTHTRPESLLGDVKFLELLERDFQVTNPAIVLGDAWNGHIVKGHRHIELAQGFDGLQDLRI